MATLQFTPLGGGLEIGANSYLLRYGDHRILLDCGLHPKKEGRAALPAFAHLDDVPEAVLVSHAHIDHCGAVPHLLRLFPSIECFATQPTAHIMDRMLHNSVSVMGTLAFEQGISDYPLYSHSDVDQAMRRTYGLGMHRAFDLTWDSPFRVSFHPAGHVLGSACILIRAPGHNVLYTGDVCVSNQELMGGLHLPGDIGPVDTLIIETTRGAQEVGRTSFGLEASRLAREATKVLRQGGVVLIPTFALGRTQELLNAIARLKMRRRLPNVPVYASGLGRAVYEIYSKYEDHLREGTELRPLREFARIGDVWERSVRREILREPCIIVATSGMMVENTPSAMLAMDVVRREDCAVFFVGYLDPDTPGYQLLHANVGDAMRFEREGHEVEIRLANRQQFTLSAHATREELLALAERIRPKNIVFIHGDAEAVEWMRANSGGPHASFAPALGDTLELGA